MRSDQWGRLVRELASWRGSQEASEATGFQFQVSGSVSSSKQILPRSRPMTQRDPELWV